MCTLSWLPQADGYALWFNRDERHTRAAELPPSERVSQHGVTWLAPHDPDSGGTWLMVNAHGLTAALLNDYTTSWQLGEAAASAGGLESRGRLVPMLVDQRFADVAVAMIAEVDLRFTPPFELVAVDAEQRAGRIHWNGSGCEISTNAAGELTSPRSSSSFEPRAVIAARRDGYPTNPSLASLAAFHRAHDPDHGAASVNMSREDAATRSICAIVVSAETVAMTYEPQVWPGAPTRRIGRQDFSLIRSEIAAIIAE